jgi:CheY-like chemotaxis protein
MPYDLWTVVGDPTQLHQVLLNLCVNARDAMPNGGKLTISAENITLDAHYAGLNPDAKAGPYVFLKIEDCGTGMPPDIMERIFEPFFTTKEFGKGTGLGLSTSLAIVKSHGGFIRVYSEVGKGTVFHINLPAHTEASPVTVAELAVEMPCGHGELVLVVDDEASVRQITKQTLEGFGYRVVLANDGVEAISIFSKRDKEIAVVLTDMMMPIMDGAATIQILRRMNHQVPIIATSGLTDSAAAIANLGVSHFLAKPFTAETLLKTLRQSLAPES